MVGVRGNLFLPSLILEWCGGKEPLFLARDHEINTDQGTAIQCYGLLNLFMIFFLNFFDASRYRHLQSDHL